MKIYLAGPIFTQRDQDWNTKLAKIIRCAYPGAQLYLAQENKAINDKTKFADSQAIFEGDYARLQTSDMLIATISGDIPPIGTSCEVAIFSQMIHDNPENGKRLICLYDDTRDMTINKEKADYAATNIAENQTCYTNLLLIGAAKRNGVILRNEQQLKEYLRILYKQDKKKLHTSGIYSFINRKNNKIYIGQSKDLQNRIEQHWRCEGISHGSAIDLAIRKYGPSAFEVEILEFCPSEKLNEAEEKWIKIKDTVAPNGYNLTLGGQQTAVVSQCREVSNYNSNGDKIETFKSVNAAAKKYNIVPQTISYCCKKKKGFHTTGGFYWAYGHELKLQIDKPKTGKASATTVYYYDPKTHQLIGSFASVSEASRFLTGNVQGASNISKACKGKFYYIYGYIWSYYYWEKAPDNYKIINELNKETIIKEKEAEFD